MTTTRRTKFEDLSRTTGIRGVLRTAGLALGALVLLAGVATAQRGKPASLLLMPEYDNRTGSASILTVTNLNDTWGVTVEFRYVGEECLEFNRFLHLSPNDTFTCLTNVHCPWQNRGFVYVVAGSADTGEAISFNWLTGNISSIDGFESFGYSVEPFAFEAPLPQGVSTDLDGDGLRDLDGREYQMAPDRLLFPRFLGQGYGPLSTDLVLINLTGSRAFTASVNLKGYNDDSEEYSALHAFFCTERVPLLTVSSLFGNSFLASTNNDPNEIVGLPQWESGWFWIDGFRATSTEQVVGDPAILGFLVEKDSGQESAVLPFASGSQGNGCLIHQDDTIVTPPGTSFCFGHDGMGTPCPCNNDNDGSLAGAGCANGVFGSGARLLGSGMASVGADSLVLTATNVEPNNSGLFFQANNAVNGGDGLPFGDGLRCAGGNVIRLQVRFANSSGISATGIAIGLKGGVSAGDVRRYQYWYRNISNPPCGAGVNDFNLTNGYEITWQP